MAYDHLDTEMITLDCDSPTVLAPLITMIGNKIRTIDIIRERLEPVETVFPDYSLDVTLLMRYAPPASDHRPFYRLSFRLKVAHRSGEANHLIKITAVAMGHFRDPFQPGSKIRDYLTQLSLLTAEETSAAFIIRKVFK